MAVSQTSEISRTLPKFTPNPLLLGVLALAVAIPVALAISVVNNAFPGQAEKAGMVVGMLFVILMAIPVGAYLLIKRRAAEPYYLGLIIASAAAILLVSSYFYSISYRVLIPADFLIWSESDFVNDIVKLRTGYPIYTADVNNESFTYPPGSQVLTYALATISGNSTSIPVYRMIQVGYTILSAIFAFLCVRTILQLATPKMNYRSTFAWGVLWLPVLLLIASNETTNPFVHNLNSDSIGQLASLIAYFVLLKYVATRDVRLLVALAIIPAVGFMGKQSVAIWTPLTFMHLLIFDPERSLKRIVGYAAMATLAFAVVLGSAYALWGEHFVYWVFTVLGQHGVSPLRSFQHILDVWPYYAVGLIGGAVLLRGDKFKLLLGPWAVWLALILIESYTSGVAWMLNHIGPGSLIAGIWFVAALTRIWVDGLPKVISGTTFQKWVGYGVAVAVVLLLFNGLGLFRIPLKPDSADDSFRYAREIQREFQGFNSNEVLLDVGTWVYVDDSVVMKDRSPSIGERGFSETGDFSGILQRLEEKRYAKILVRNLHSGDFWYDHELWDTSSGIRKALLDNYHEVGLIEGVEGEDDRYLYSDVSILVPKS